MIRIHYKDGRNIPVLMCDVCGTWIEDAKEGAAVFVTPQNNGDTTDVMHVHKRACHDAAEAKLGGRAKCSWQELSEHMLHLTHNTALPVERLKEIADRQDQFGL